MAKPITANEAHELIQYHTRLRSGLEKARRTIVDFDLEIRDALDEYVSGEVFRMLDGIAVEELNSDKRGLRIKLLREAGINTIADVLRMTPRSLAEIKGVSQNAANEIYLIAAQIKETVCPEIRLKLNADEKTPHTSRIVLAVYRQQESRNSLGLCEDLISFYEQNIAQAINDLSLATKSVGWLFLSSSQKAAIENAVYFLSGKAVADYKEDVSLVLDDITDLQHALEWEAWNDFESDPVRYLSILENIAPNLFAAKEIDYAGLDQKLLEIINKEIVLTQGLKCTLRRYQEFGVKFILHQERLILGDEMGLGKTIQAIAAMTSLRNMGERYFLVICPASVISNWCHEIGRHCDLPVTKVHNSKGSSPYEVWLQKGGICVTTYDFAARIKIPVVIKLSMLVIDEAHMIKHTETKRSINATDLCDIAERVLLMTGTPLENNAEEMVSLIWCLDPKLGNTLKPVAQSHQVTTFRKMVAPVYLRRKREDVLTELPKLIELREWCHMTPQEEGVYAEAVFHGTRMAPRRASWSLDDLTYSSKAQRLLAIINDATKANRKVIVFSFFRDTLEKVKNMLGDQCAGLINGSIPPMRRQEIIDQFEDAPSGSVLVAQIEAGGVGLNIQAASVVVICEPQYKPSTENQAISRAYRMGQTRNVIVYRLLCEESIDERMTDRLDVKQRIFDEFADVSESAKKEAEIDDKTFDELLKEEYQRLLQKHQKNMILA